ncbi:hypothetical protein [uncultured Gammaproteobacteria bacterium]|jgi:hypothetical protein|nr:hypothetical protein [uncultured Gammaproteobacteria bacterium]CAC9557123.1 hypothetical protein [uncultured Gammaproteobacteria bacterium]CAC9567103.1 hypothetical protein [uncultured Gammaproteobacteria bacterium]CAC9583446.1 hypothetical protein [uncultured Gammaproteobacteria bacterium]CAC9617378.1 hypothetical protein [uncultured Gammaproteobacteria bacterium]
MESNSSDFIRKIINSRNAIPSSTDQEKKQDLSESLSSKKRKQELRHKNSKHELAVGIYKKLFWAICVYIFLVLLLLTGNEHYFQLKDAVLITLLSTTTANILGVFYIASKWLYETNK